MLSELAKGKNAELERRGGYVDLKESDRPLFLDPIRLFIGWDEREAIGGHVFIQSLIRTTKYPVSLTIITPEMAQSLAPTDGSNPFSKARFLVPYLCGFRGSAIWMDGADQLLRASLVELWAHREAGYGVQVVKHDYQTKASRKYLNTGLEADNADYPKKNWSSVILWHCDYFPHRNLTPSFVTEKPGKFLHRFNWMPEGDIGDLPNEWNHLVTEQPFNKDAKLAHFTLGIPGMEYYRHADYAPEWTADLKSAAKGLQYLGR